MVLRGVSTRSIDQSSQKLDLADDYDDWDDYDDHDMQMTIDQITSIPTMMPIRLLKTTFPTKSTPIVQLIGVVERRNSH